MTDAFEPIEDDDRPLGPPALLLGGFAAQETAPLERLLQAIGAPKHRLIRCSRELLDLSVEAALGTDIPGEALSADQLPRAVILSGMTGRQIHDFIDGYGATGLDRPIWASVTVHSLQLTVKALLKELLSEQRAMAAQQAAEESPS